MSTCTNLQGTEQIRQQVSRQLAFYGIPSALIHRLGKADDYNNRLNEVEGTVSELRKLYGDDRVTFVKADVTNAQDVEGTVAKCVEVFGRLDILCCNAGISVESTHPRPLGVHETSESDWDKTMAINAKGVFLGCKYGIAQMLKQDLLPGSKDRGWIVNTASIQGLIAYYNTRKAFHPLRSCELQTDNFQLHIQLPRAP